MSQNESEIEAGPVVKVSRDLREIERLYRDVVGEAINRAGAKVDGTSLPGGAAMIALAPVGSPEEHGEQLAAAEFRHFAACEKGDHTRCRYAEHEADEDGHEPILQTLLFWTEAWRAETGYPLEGRTPSVATEANFIRGMLNWAWENLIEWDDFAADVNRARVRMENLLHAGVRAERSRVPCTNPACERSPMLIRVYGATVVFDHYKCPSCKMRYDQQGFIRAKLQHLDSQGADRHVKMQDARDAIDRPDRTWRKWLRLWYVRSYRDIKTGQVWVWWPDAREMDLSTRRRNRSVS
jgi:hypothetical protein